MGWYSINDIADTRYIVIDIDADLEMLLILIFQERDTVNEKAQ